MKLCTMREAVAATVRDGDSLVIDGFTHLICFAAAHEIIRQRRRGLTAIRLTPDLVYDQLIEAGCVDKLVFSWAMAGAAAVARRRMGRKAACRRGVAFMESPWLRSVPAPAATGSGPAAGCARW